MSPHAPAPLLSVVIPAFNEAGRLPATLTAIDAFFRGRCTIEIIVVDDGSTDATATVAAGRPGVVLIQNLVNSGKGHSVRRGVLAARGERVLICDADGSTPIGEFAKLAAALDAGADVAIGSRDLPDSVVSPRQPLLRRVVAGLLRSARRRRILPEIRDTQCGFKLFRRSVAHEVFGGQTLTGWLFDCEVLALAAERGCRIVEVGVRWANDPSSRVRLVGDLGRTWREYRYLVRRFGRRG